MNSTSITETLRDAIPLSKAAGFIPNRPHTATIWRWATKGCRGQKLRTWQLGGTRVTTPAAIEDFLQRLNADASSSDAHESHDVIAKRGRDAGRALESLGC